MFLNRCSKDYLKFCLTKMIQIGVCQESGPVVFSFTTSSTLHGLPRAVVFTRAWIRFISNKHMALRSCFSVSFLCADFPSPPRAYWPNRALLTEAWAERDNGKRFECSVFIRSISDVTFDCALRTTVNRVPHRKAGLAERLENEPTEDEAMIVVSLVSQQYCYEHVLTQPWTVKQLKIFNRQKRAIFTVKEKPFFFFNEPSNIFKVFEIPLFQLLIPDLWLSKNRFNWYNSFHVPKYSHFMVLRLNLRPNWLRSVWKYSQFQNINDLLHWNVFPNIPFSSLE